MQTKSSANQCSVKQSRAELHSRRDAARGLSGARSKHDAPCCCSNEDPGPLGASVKQKMESDRGLLFMLLTC